MIVKTRMHSSRIRTVRSSSRLSRGGGVCLSACWDTSPPRTRHPPGADPPPKDQAPPPPVADTPREQRSPCGQIQASENITFATSLRTVIMFDGLRFSLWRIRKFSLCRFCKFEVESINMGIVIYKSSPANGCNVLSYNYIGPCPAKGVNLHPGLVQTAQKRVNEINWTWNKDYALRT